MTYSTGVFSIPGQPSPQGSVFEAGAQDEQDGAQLHWGSSPTRRRAAPATANSKRIAPA